jgi:hypothetical protein
MITTPPKTVTIALTRMEAIALLRAADIGVRVIEALDLPATTTATASAMAKLAKSDTAKAS